MKREETILTVEQTLGTLRQVVLGGNRQTCTGLDTSRFSAVKECISCWQDYGQYNENRWRIMHDGRQDEIKIGGYVFAPVIKDIHFFLLSSSRQSHTITLNGQNPEGEIFELDFKFDNDNLLPYLIYAMILTAKLHDEKKISRYWNYLMGDKFNVSVGELLDDACRIKEISAGIIKEYPFMQLFLQEGLKKIKQELKSELDSLDLFK